MRRYNICGLSFEQVFLPMANRNKYEVEFVILQSIGTIIVTEFWKINHFVTHEITALCLVAVTVHL